MSRPATTPLTESRFSHRLDTLQELARDVLAYAEKQGASACEVDVSTGFGQSVTVRCGEVETIEYSHRYELERDLSVRYGIGRSLRPYDGEREARSFGQLSVLWRF